MFHAALLSVIALSPSAVVQRFYDRYLAGTASTTLAQQYFTPDFARSYIWIIDAQKCLKKTVILDFNPFFSSQVENLAAVAGTASVEGAIATVPVKTTLKLSHPFPGRMTVKLQRIDGEWLISDFLDKDGQGVAASFAKGRSDYRQWKLSSSERACISAIH
jgi:hypothetical protein